MKTFFTLLFIIQSFALSAQSVKGYVLTQKDKSPVQFASVALLNLPDSSIAGGVITLTSGEYSFDKVKSGNYYIKVSYLGYAPGGVNVKVGGSAAVIKADTIFLSETTKALAEVTVTGQRLQGKELVDRTVYAVPDDVAKSSMNGYDILKKIPQVQVDFQNNVTLNGSTNFIIQVDGKQRDKEFLARLLPSDIESIEIISNPSGKYEGNIDGVINIILKKEARFGISGNVGAYVKPFNKQTMVGNGSVDYGLGKITFYVSGFAFSQELHMSTKDSTHFNYNDSVSKTDGNGLFKVSSSSINTGFDYYITDKNNLSFNMSYKPIDQQSSQDSKTYLFGNNNDYSMGTLNNSKLHSDEGTFTLFYKKTYKKPVQEFSSEAIYYLFKSKDATTFSNSIYPINSDIFIDSTYRHESNINKRSYFSEKLNYVQPIGLSTKLEGGYQFYYQDMNYDFTSNVDNMSNTFNYSEFRNSVYAGITLNLKKVGIQSNIRIENTLNRVDSAGNNGYTAFLPSANFQYKFSGTQNLKFTYNRRINRPGVYDLNPFEKVSFNKVKSSGNSRLEPEYRDKLQLTYTWNFGKNYFSPNIYYERISNKIGRTNELDTTNNFIISKPYNLLTGYERGFGINALLWFVNLNVRFYQGHYDAYNKGAMPIPARNYSSFSSNSYAYYQFKNKLTTFVFLGYNGVSIDAQSKTYITPLYGLGAQKQAGNHSFGFFYLMPFSKDITYNKTITQNASYYSDNRVIIDLAYYIQFMYSYKFNKGKNVKKLNRKVEVESDSKSGAIGN